MSARRNRRRKIFVPLFVASMGLVALSNAANKPRFATFRTVDVVQLIAVGMCFGVALVTLISFLRGGPSD